VGTNGDNLGRRQVYTIVRRYMELAGINKGKYGPHVLRHSFCTRLHQKGVAPFIIKELAGHKSLNTTMRYVKIENKEQAEAIARLELGTMNLSYNHIAGGKWVKGMEKVKDYLKLNDKYLREGDALLEKGEYIKASEKFWGATVEVIKAIAAKRGADIRSHGEIYQFITMLSKELGDRELLRCFAGASALHQNFYENWLTPEMVVDYANGVKALVEKLKGLS